MPIKFRCQHCRQFLGISRSKAGTITDCPMCGRTIRVPELDGTVRSLPKPGLDMEDSRLASALDELASIEKPGAAAVAQNAEDADQGQVIVSRGEPEPIELEPLPEPEAIQVQAPLPPAGVTKNDDEERPWAETAQPGDSWKKLLAAAEAGPVQQENAPSQSAAAPGKSDARPVASVPPPVASPSAQTSSRRPAAAVLCAAGGIAALIFAAGFWIGRITTIQPEESQQTANDDGNRAGQTAADGGSPNEKRSTAFQGRVTYRTESGESKPDQGARIIVFPVDRSGTTRLPVTGFQSQAAPQDYEIALTALRALGGDAAVADDSGVYEIALPQSGEFHVLVLSNSLRRDDEGEDADAQAVIAEYFHRPESLLGRLEYQLDRVRYTGEGTDTLDYSLPRG